MWLSDLTGPSFSYGEKVSYSELSFKVVLLTVITEILVQLSFPTTVERLKHKVQPSTVVYCRETSKTSDAL